MELFHVAQGLGNVASTKSTPNSGQAERPKNGSKHQENQDFEPGHASGWSVDGFVHVVAVNNVPIILLSLSNTH